MSTRHYVAESPKEMALILILYAFSIIARYLSDLWFQMTMGSSSEIRSLLEYYLTMIDLVVPEQALSRITGDRIVNAQPGSLGGRA